MAVTILSADRCDPVVTVLSDAFYHYPVMRYVLGDGPDYDRRLLTLVGLFTAARANPNGLMLGLDDPRGTMVGGAMVDLPGGPAHTPAFDALRESAWAVLGAAARARYEAYGRASREHDHGSHHHHLGMIGVVRSHHGSGLGRALLEHVHGLAEADPDSSGVSLTTEVARNVAFYEHFGYELVGHTRVAPDLETWSFFRPVTRSGKGGPSPIRRDE